MTRILFVCTGNTCRSPMAESMLRHMAAERGVTVEVRSAGVAAIDGTAMSVNAQKVLQEWSMPNDAFYSNALGRESMDWADLILTLTSGHKQHLLQRFNDAGDKVFTLKEFVEEGNLSSEANQVQHELHTLMTELQLKLSMGQQPTEQEIAKVYELQGRMPSLDIQDPYGGSLLQYQATAEEIRAALERLLDKLDQK